MILSDADQNLTELEQAALDSEINLSDGHARQSLTPSQKDIVAALPDFFDKARRTPYKTLEREALEAFFSALGQHSAPIGAGRVFSAYSSSVATIAAAYAMADRGDRVALLHPTFDNIHDLMSRQVDVVPLHEPVDPESAVSQALAQRATVLYITTPNNPTGRYLDEPALAGLVDQCVAHDLALCLDASFRGFDPRAQFDHYRLLENPALRYIVVEDTGKLWPVQELKLGFMAVSEHWRYQVEHALSDILLNVSPTILALVTALARDAASGGLGQLHELIRTNRQALLDGIAAMPGVTVMDPDAVVPVARIGLPDSQSATHLLEKLRGEGVHLLPGEQFHWHAPREGASMLRMALGRDTAQIAEAARRMAAVWDSYLVGAR